MGPTLAEILTYEPFRRAQAYVIAGEGALDRPVRWMHISEMPHPERLFRGGELLLTQGRGIPSGRADQHRWIRDIAAADVAGVAVEIGVVHPRLPPGLVTAARETGLPLIELRHPAYFMDMTEAVHTAIVNIGHGLLQRGERIGRDFLRLILHGATPGRMIEELSRLVGNPVVLEDRTHEVLEYTPDTPEVNQRMQDWAAHARIGHPAPEDLAPTRSTGDTPCVWAPIVVRGESRGNLHVLELSRTCDDADRIAVARAADAIGLAFIVTSDAERQNEDARSALLHDLLRGHYSDAAQVRRRAAAYGVDLSNPVRVAALRPLDQAGGERAGNRLGPVLRKVAAVAASLLGGEHRPLLGYDGGQVVAIVPEPARTPRNDVAGPYAQIVQRCAATESIRLIAGVSDLTGLAGLSAAFNDAEDAVRYAVRTGQGPGVFEPGRLGINRLLLELDQGDALARHVERELGQVLDHDAAAPVPLLPTLITYLDHGGVKSAVARALNIERRTLYYRLQRIERLVHGSLDDADTRLRLHIAVRGLEFRRHRPGRSRSR